MITLTQMYNFNMMTLIQMYLQWYSLATLGVSHAFVCSLFNHFFDEMKFIQITDSEIFLPITLNVKDYKILIIGLNYTIQFF